MGLKFSCLISSVAFFALLSSCSTPGTGLFTKRSPHQLYAQKLTDAGLHQTALGKAWFRAAERSLTTPVSVQLPYTETGYFTATKTQAAGLRFSGNKGEKLIITLEKRPVKEFAVYMDLWAESARIKLMASADTLTNTLNYEVDDAANFVLTLQPELLSGGEYTLRISVGPSLGYPLKNKNRNQIQSYFGDGRDNGTRRHEGVDIFSKFKTPVIAAAPGIITRVNQTTLGGKVVWLKPRNKNYTLYYAHLDSQLVSSGQLVNPGDTLGLMGNTGNAITTSPHLHFGIYTINGAVDPLPYINPVLKEPEKISASITNIGKEARTAKQGYLYQQANVKSSQVRALPANSLLTIEAATSNWYKVTLPDDITGFVPGAGIQPLLNPLKRIRLQTNAPLYDMPDTLAARKAVLAAEAPLNLLAVFNGFYWVQSGNQTGWVAAATAAP